MASLIDTHCHLCDEQYSNEKRQEIIKNMPFDNLEKVITVSYSMESSKDSVKISNENNNVFCAVGVHPENIDEIDINTLEELAKNKKVVAIGEIGLDYHYEGFDKEKQKQALIEQLKLAKKINLPVIIHLRDAYEDLKNILLEYKDILTKIVIHCYSGSLEYAKEILNLGVYFSFTGIITFKNARKVLDVIDFLPLNRIMIETDCPYLCPEPFRGNLNEPKMVKYVLEKICEIKRLDIETVSKAIRNNVKEFFGI